MIDWFTGYVGYDASEMAIGRFVEVSRHGEMVRDRPRWETATGSYAAGVQVTRSTATEQMVAHSRDMGFLCSTSVLRISGNPAKFLQGHNAAGPSVSHLGPMLQAMVRQFGEGLRPRDADDPRLPAVQRSRVDITTAVDLGSHQAVHEWIAHAAKHSRTRHGRAMDSGTTVYWGKNSTRWSLKAYCKHCEMLAHPPSLAEMPDQRLYQELVEWTQPHVRIELTLRRPELKLRGSLDESIIWDFFKRVEVSAMAPKKEPDAALRPVVRMALRTWYGGTDLITLLPRRTAYRFRKEILEATGIDVFLPHSEQDKGAKPALLGLDELREREVKNVPERIQRSLFGAGV